MNGFRQLNEEEEVEIEFKITDKGLEAIKVTGPSGEDCRGSEVRHQARRKYRKMRYIVFLFCRPYLFDF